MADLSITAANVAIGSQTTQTSVVQFGEAIAQGQAIFRDATNGKFFLADANNSPRHLASGIAITAAGIDGFGFMASRGLINLGATLVKGTIYVVSDTPGGIKPAADLLSLDNVVILGAAVSSSLLNLQIQPTGAIV